MLTAEDLAFVADHLSFMSRLKPQQAQQLRAACNRALYAPGALLHNRQEKCNGLVIVKSGQLRAYFESEDGKEITLFRLLPGNVCILSASCVLKNITFEVTLAAEKESEVLFIPAAVWEQLSAANSEVREFSMEIVNERFSEVMWIMEQMVSRNMGQRIAAFLLQQAEFEKSATLQITHEAIAKNLGTAREVVSRILKYLENNNLIQLGRGQVILTDLDGLREMSR